MKIPDAFKQILQKDERLHSCILQIVSDFQPILRDNKLYFFEEYTDHGIEHIESVLNAAAEIIIEESYVLLSAKDIAVLIMAIILHDLGMHIEYSTFLAFLNGEYDDVRINSLDKKTWKQLWNEYLSEAKRFSSKQRYLYFGNENQPFKEPNLSNKDSLDGADKKLIGEFVRRFHTRFAHEVALKGLVGKDGQIIEFGGSRLDKIYKQLAGMVARSHGMNLRNTFPYLREISGEAWKNPNDINITFLMVVLRIADYFQFDNLRVDKMLLKLKTFKSPVSQTEHDKHLAIDYVQTHFDDVERLYVRAEPDNSNIFVKLDYLIKDIQHELDMSWAVLGEIYSRSPKDRQPQIKYRRINSNLEDESFYNNLPYVPERISFQSDVELPKLLIAPLYGNSPKYGVRELIQNAVDACLERDFEEKQKGGAKYTPKVKLEIKKSGDDVYEFTIEDNGKGMSLSEIKNYFLRVGSSFRKSLDWKKEFTDEKGNSLISRNGKFGIGVLAAFLLGNEIEVKTRHFNEEFGYSFKTSIDTDQIELKIDKTHLESGTKIKILISNEVVESLTEREYYSSKNLWSDWYLLNFPLVEYYLNGKKLKVSSPINSNDLNWHYINTPLLKELAWAYLDAKTEYWKGEEYLVCNGIRIPEGLASVKTGCRIITKIPTLLITDNDGNLPITLDRNRLDGNLPFIDDLVADIAKDLIAFMLNLKINSNENISQVKFSNPNTFNLAFLKDGFSLQIDYFFERLNSRNFKFIRFITSNKELPLAASSILKNYVFIPITNSSLTVNGAEGMIKPRNGGMVMLKKDKYEKLFDPKMNRIGGGLKNKHKVEYSNSEIFVFSYLYPSNSYSGEFKRLVEKYSSFAESIQEINFHELILNQNRDYWVGTQDGKVLSSLFEKYFGDNVVIPYEFNERKKMYPLAFEELKDYMKKYQEGEK
jgi:molecular chaperone HtpG